MGVKGLWKLLEGTGQPVTLESLEGKVLAIDVSLWLNMAIKGMRDLHGHSASDAHLITLFHRICKLLYFGVKPVFVFDGKAPLLKQKTLQERRQKKQTHVKQSKAASEKLLQNYLKRQVLNTAIKGKKESEASNSETQPSQIDRSIKEIKKVNCNEEEELYKLPESQRSQDLLNSSDEEKEDQWHKRSSTREAVYGTAMAGDFKQMMSVDVNSSDFKSLPSDIQHELLHDIKEIRKRRRTQIEAMPDQSESFSNYQLQGILAKRELSGRIEKIEKQMQEENAIAMSMMGDGYDMSNVTANRLISDEKTHFVLISKLSKKADAKKAESDADVAYLSNIASTSGDAKPTANEQISFEPPVESLLLSRVETSQPNSTVNSLSSAEKSSTLLLKQNLNDELNSEAISSSSEEELDAFLTKPSSVAIAQSNVNNQSLLVSPDENPEFELPSQPKSPSSEDNDNPTTIQQDNADTTQINNHVSQIPLESPIPLAVDSVSEKCNVSADELVDFVEVEDNATESQGDLTKVKSLADVDSETSDGLNVSDQWLEGEADFEMLTEQLEAEDILLIEKMRSSVRAARDVSDAATTESQQLLQLFGVPYLVSPQEAESQCAYLNHAGLTMGTITDDSDVWLFGGRVVYKDVFAKKRDPTLYSINDIKAELGLERHHMISIGLCSGSDYTVGIDGVGPVTALEIMQEFPGKGIEGLKDFKEWWDSAHKQVGFISNKETKIRASLRKLVLPSGFPSELVADAYLKPTVCESKEIFSWGMPDLDAIRDFLIGRLHWTKGKVDESLLPVLKRAAERNSQAQITSYFPRLLPMQKSKRSKRVVRAITAMAKPRSSETVDKNIKNKPTRGRKRTKQSTRNGILSKRASSSTKEPCLSESSSSD